MIIVLSREENIRGEFACHAVTCKSGASIVGA